jgi:hypothetical protein
MKAFSSALLAPVLPLLLGLGIQTAQAAYHSSICMSENHGGKAGGGVLDQPTRSACALWHTVHSRSQTRIDQVRNGRCVSDEAIDGPLWWDYCVRYGAGSGQCNE